MKINSTVWHENIIFGIQKWMLKRKQIKHWPTYMYMYKSLHVHVVICTCSRCTCTCSTCSVVSMCCKIAKIKSTDVQTLEESSQLFSIKFSIFHATAIINRHNDIPYKMIYWREKYLANLSLKYNWRILYWRFCYDHRR